MQYTLQDLAKASLLQLMDFKSIVKTVKTRRRRGVVGVEAAIVLIAFVIVAAALAFVVLNMGFSTTQKAKTTISEGLASSGSAMEVAGMVTAHTLSNKSGIDVIAIPIKISSGSSSVDLSNATLAVRYLSKTVSYDNIYNGTLHTTSYASLNDALTAADTSGQISSNPLGGTLPSSSTALIYWDQNLDQNSVLDAGEHAVLVIAYKAADVPRALDKITAEVLTPRGSTLTVDRTIPTLTDTYMNLS